MAPSPTRPDGAADKNPLAARRLAWQALDRLDAQDRTLDAILEEFSYQRSLFSQADRALFQSLVFGILRRRAGLDYIVDAFSRTPLKKIEPPVLNLLRLGLFQIVHLDRIPVSAAVNTAVELAKSSRPIWVVRFVNALLRRAAAEYQTLTYPDPASDPVAALAIQKSFPEWMIRRWIRREGLEETIRRCDAVNAVPPVTLRANTLKVSRETLQAALTPSASGLLPTRFALDGLKLTGLT
jgi:16S rRNA (cytosine967-C5)-methyltransferase